MIRTQNAYYALHRATVVLTWPEYISSPWRAVRISAAITESHAVGEAAGILSCFGGRAVQSCAGVAVAGVQFPGCGRSLTSSSMLRSRNGHDGCRSPRALSACSEALRRSWPRCRLLTSEARWPALASGLSFDHASVTEAVTDALTQLVWQGRPGRSRAATLRQAVLNRCAGQRAWPDGPALRLAPPSRRTVSSRRVYPAR